MEKKNKRKKRDRLFIIYEAAFWDFDGGLHLNVDGWKPYSFSSTGKWRIRTILLEKASIYHLVRCFEFNATVLRSSFLM